MQTTGTLSRDINAYYEAWAKMMITIWQDKVAALRIHDTGALFSSFHMELLSQSGGNIDKIVFTYLYYGRMVDMGVGRGVKFGDYMLTGKKRKTKPWYNKSFFHSLKVMNEKRAELYGEEFQAIIHEALNF